MSLVNLAGDVMRKSNLALALAAAFAASPALGQVSVDQKLQILQQEIDDLKARPEERSHRRSSPRLRTRRTTARRSVEAWPSPAAGRKSPGSAGGGETRVA